MSQTIADSDEIKLFAAELEHFNGQLGDAMARLIGRFHRLGDTWRDQEHQAFAAEFEQTMRVLQHFQRQAEEQIPFLRTKAQLIDEYLGYRR